MTYLWLVTPYFFDDYDSALNAAVPASQGFHQNNATDVNDRSPEVLARTHVPIAEFVAQTVSCDEIPVSIAGVCAANLPVMAVLQKSGRDASGDDGRTR
jgi:hypothetical protein